MGTGARVALIGQNVNEHPSGAYTGEISTSMLLDYGCRYVILGHSERRTLHGEDDITVAAKARAAIDAGLGPIVCVGETLAQREAGESETVVCHQIRAVAGTIGAETVDRITVAYEPIWAIGTGRTATPEQAQAVHTALRDEIGRIDPQSADQVRIVYGGSVKAANALELFRQPDIDGGLIGGASLDAEEFVAICRAAGRTSDAH